ncbi:MAG: ABC transporter ATP-binding protein, partial [Firmicutes bacterium]|nr:ABC transporter ATP-binding protein [Bacillota bacterium]
MLRYMRKYWIFAILAAGFMIAEVTVDMIQPRLMADIVDNGILGLSGDGTPDLALIRTVGIRMILIVLAGGLFGMLSGTMANLCSQNFGNKIRKKCFDRIMHLSFEQTDAFTTGSLITRVTNDVSQVERLVSQLVRGFIRCLMFMVVGTITLMSLNVHFLVIIACAFPLVLLDIGFILWKTNPLFSLLQGRIDNLNGVIQENINGTRVVKAFIQEDREAARFDDANTSLVDTQLRVLILMSFLRPIMNIVLNLATVALIWVGAIQVQAGGMQPGEVMAAVTYISQILNGMMMLAMIFQTLARGRASAKRINQVLEADPVIKDGTVTEESLLALYADKAGT